jgi:pimeloyl-ACP methyl ester carboxylesterase
MRAPLVSRRSALVGGLALVAVRRASATASLTIIKAADGREVQISIWPAVGVSRGLILFSHGALSGPGKYERLMGPWTEAGFRVMAPLHVDSTDHPDHANYGMAESWRARLLDMRALSAFAGGEAYVAAGHSYGALVALTLAGATSVVPPGLSAPLRDPHAKCVVAFSPPGATPGLATREAYATLAVPAFIQTGDNDIPFGAKDGRWQVHLDSYDAAPAGDKYALVLQGVDHYFGGLICNPDKPGPPQAAQLARAAAISTLFLEAFATHDEKARAALDDELTASGPAILIRK